MATITYDTEIDQESLVFDWRFEELQRAGYPSSEAFLLAAAKGVDLHLAVRLLDEGCSPATAARILF